MSLLVLAFTGFACGCFVQLLFIFKYPACQLCETQSLLEYGVLRYKRPITGLIRIVFIINDKQRLWFTGRFFAY